MIFFFGCSRTASKAYQHILNKNTDVHISRELHLISSLPKKTLFKVYLKYKLVHHNLRKLCDEIETLRSSTFWKTKQFDAELFFNYLTQKKIQKLTFKSLIQSILDCDAVKNEKKIIGAKFPVHIFFYPVFKNLWGFEKAKYIFLARKPEHIIFSQFNKHEMKNKILRISMIFYVAFMFNFTVFYRILSSRKKIHFIKYEDFKTKKDQVIKRLCEFINQEYTEEMLTVKVFDSLIRKNASDYNLTSIEGFLLNTLTFPWVKIYNKY